MVPLFPVCSFVRQFICAFAAVGFAVLMGTIGNPVLAQTESPSVNPSQNQTTWVLFRHAEREEGMDRLSEEGQARAELIRQLGEILPVAAIYTTDYQRTRQTVAPLSKSSGLSVQLYDPREQDWWKEAAEQHAGKVIFVAGHSNTTIALATAISGQAFSPMTEDQYDRLFVVRQLLDSATAVEVNYGAASEATQDDGTEAETTSVGVGAKPLEGATLLLDGTREMLDQNWTYWDGPRFSSSLPIKWKVVEDPVDAGQAVMTFDPAAAGGKYGAADIVTKEKFRDFRLHVEFLIKAKGGNSGVYLQNRYEIQVLDGDKTTHGMAAVINERAAPYEVYNGTGKWNSYDIIFRAARFEDGKRTHKALVTMYFNGKKVHANVPITRVWGGPASGIDGDNDEAGNGIKDTPGGLKLQAEGHEVLYRNIWIKKLDLEKVDTDLQDSELQK